MDLFAKFNFGFCDESNIYISLDGIIDTRNRLDESFLFNQEINSMILLDLVGHEL